MCRSGASGDQNCPLPKSGSSASIIMLVLRERLPESDFKDPLRSSANHGELQVRAGAVTKDMDKGRSGSIG